MCWIGCLMKKTIKYTDEKQNMKVIESYRIILLFLIINYKFRQKMHKAYDIIYIEINSHRKEEY